MTKTRNLLPDVAELYRTMSAEMTPTEWRTFEGTLSMFLKEGTRKQLKNVEICSKSTVSRFLNTISTEK
ncbi:hypothetical protein, partial [Deinococcus xinjiangensis]|uniref:hypothetical protein n=1 Tax=Deinococcus xinjiangensis TaxID=457454 RepID=UPI00336538EE